MRCACRGDVYDISAALLKEYLYGAAHGIHRDKGIEPEYPFRLFVYDLPYVGHIVHDARIVYERIRSAEFPDGKQHQLILSQRAIIVYIAFPFVFPFTYLQIIERK